VRDVALDERHELAEVGRGGLQDVERFDGRVGVGGAERGQAPQLFPGAVERRVGVGRVGQGAKRYAV
jgi:hypothetical protein